MKKINFKIKLLGAIFALITCNQGNAYENDLGTQSNVNLPVTISFGKEEESASTAVMILISHRYTNTIECSFTMNVPLPNKRTLKRDLKDITIFPFITAHDNFVTILPLSDLGIEDHKWLNGNQEVVAECRGRDPIVPLPKYICPKPLELQKACSYVDKGQKYLPLMIDRYFIGNCNCDSRD